MDASGQTWSDTDDSQLTAAVPVIRSSNITYTIGSTGDYPTVGAALSALDSTMVLHSRQNKITLQLLPETISETGMIQFSPLHSLVEIQGTLGNSGSGTTYQISSVHAITGGAGNWSVTYTMDTVTDIAVGDHLWVKPDAPSNPWWHSVREQPHKNTFEITAVDGANSRVTVKNTHQQSSWHANIVPPNGLYAHVFKTKWRLSTPTRPGMLIEGHRRPLTIGNMVVTSSGNNSSSPTIQVRNYGFEGQQYQTEGTLIFHTMHITAPESGGYGLYMLNSSIRYCLFSVGGCGSRGILMSNSHLDTVSVHGCVNDGVQGFDSYFRGSVTGCGNGAYLARCSFGELVTGYNENWGAQATQGSFVTIRSSEGSVSGGLQCTQSSGGNYNSAAGHYINDGTSPAVNTVGNQNSYISNVE